jgi:chromate reductase
MTYDAAVSMAPADLTFEEADIGALPLCEDDIRTEQVSPAEAARLRARMAAADAVLSVSPEYDFSLPGVLKNALDRASRAPDQPFKSKPVPTAPMSWPA